MNRIISAATMLAAATLPSIAEVRYDRSLEKAAMAIVAGKMGELRGGFSYSQKPRLVVRQSETRRTTGETRNRPAAIAPTAPSPVEPSASITTF